MLADDRFRELNVEDIHGWTLATTAVTHEADEVKDHILKALATLNTKEPEGQKEEDGQEPRN